MPAIVTDDGVKLHIEETGQGEPLLFVHEFAGDHRSWEPQVRFFSAAYRCVTYAARGYPPSDVPTDPEAYSQERAVADAIAVLDGLKIGHAPPTPAPSPRTRSPSGSGPPVGPRKPRSASHPMSSPKPHPMSSRNPPAGWAPGWLP